MAAISRANLVDKVYAEKAGAFWTPLKVIGWEGFVCDVEYKIADLRTQGYLSIKQHPHDKRQPRISHIGHIWFPKYKIPEDLKIPFYHRIHEIDEESKITRFQWESGTMKIDDITGSLRKDAPRLYALMTTALEEFPTLREQVEQIKDSLPKAVCSYE